MISSTTTKRFNDIAEAQEEFSNYINNKPPFNQRDFPDERCPTHYNNVIQPWEYMESTLTDEGFTGYLEGNIIKYISRWRTKNGLEDLKKAQHYLDKLIKTIED